MSKSLQSHTALNGVKASDLAVAIQESPATGMITLRGDFSDSKFTQAVHTLTGCEIPAQRRVSVKGVHQLCWMSPDELLVVCPYETVDALVDQFAEKLKGVHHLAVNVSDARAMFIMEGAQSREILGKGFPVDLSVEAFGLGDLRRSRIEHIAVAVWMAQPDQFTVVCFRSIAAYLWAWLTESAKIGSLPEIYAAQG